MNELERSAAAIKEEARLVVKERKRQRMFRRALIVWIVVFSFISLLGQYNNHQRINDIQKSRVFSCQRNYLTTRDIFKPFFPPKKHRTAKQQHDIEKFIRLTNPSKCIKQTATK